LRHLSALLKESTVMFDALQIAATGMQAQQQNVDTIANNLANVNTAGFKKARVTFSDLVRQGVQPAGVASDAGAGAGALDARPRIGTGVGIAAIAKLFDAGDVRKTDMPLDIAIAGEGFFEVEMPDGVRAYTRAGSLKVNSEGLLSTQSGQVLKPNVMIPDKIQALVITRDGKVQVSLPNQATPVETGRLDMVRFANPGALTALGDNLYRSSETSGEPIAGRPGEDAMGTVRQGFLEGSNVKMVEEVVNLMLAQRAYEASVKVVQASDDMLAMVNNLRK
jgi:flagellar basal-body rod protein FlgG